MPWSPACRANIGNCSRSRLVFTFERALLSVSMTGVAAFHLGGGGGRCNRELDIDVDDPVCAQGQSPLFIGGEAGGSDTQGVRTDVEVRHVEYATAGSWSTSFRTGIVIG